MWSIYPLSPGFKPKTTEGQVTRKELGRNLGHGWGKFGEEKRRSRGPVSCHQDESGRGTPDRRFRPRDTEPLKRTDSLSLFLNRQSLPPEGSE